MRRMLRRHVTCTCHDPTVFGHLACRGETQPRYAPPFSPGPTSLNIQGRTITCAIYDEIRHMNQLSAAIGETTRQARHLEAMLQYLMRRYAEPPPPHN